jgi:8-oxo-dGTP diphosphatase
MDEEDHGRKSKMIDFRNYITEAKENPYRYTGANPTVDLVVFRRGEKGLEVLLIKRASGSVEGGKWAIPGGFVNTTAKAGGKWKDGQTESIADAAIRELEEETGLKITPELRRGLRSVGIYKGGGRDPRDNKISWSVSYAYTIVIPRGMGNRVRGMDDASDAKWYPVGRLPRLAFDHKDIITDSLGEWQKSEEGKEKKERVASTQEVQKAFSQEREGMTDVFGGLLLNKTPWYTDFAHPEVPYEEPDQKQIDALRQKIWGVKQGSRLPDLWVYASSLKPSKGLRYVSIKPLPREEMFSATHEDLFPEMAKLRDEQALQGRIDHDRKVITAIIGVWSKKGSRVISNSTIDRVFAELKKLYPGYKIYDQIGESKIMSFSTFITEANRGLSQAKDRWQTVGISDVKGNRDVQQDIFDIINAAYAPLGGHPDFPNADSVPADNNITDIIDTDAPDDVDGVVLSKTTPFGKKLTTLGSDGGAEAKREVLKKAVDILNTQGSYVEASGKVLDILVARGAPVVKDENTVRTVLRGKEIEWHGDGVYSRKIGAKTHRKTMLGKPRA